MADAGIVVVVALLLQSRAHKTRVFFLLFFSSPRGDPVWRKYRKGSGGSGSGLGTECYLRVCLSALAV
uniref:Putative secreted protein n=1 Tax=Anopheles darlingi TaxID=43151 RepID=A0A2M4DBF3_ANODA